MQSAKIKNGDSGSIIATFFLGSEIMDSYFRETNLQFII
jgi:hypothetical protein